MLTFELLIASFEKSWGSTKQLLQRHHKLTFENGRKYRSYSYFPLKEVKSRPPRKPLELPRLHGLLFHCALLQQAPGDSGMFSSYGSSDSKRASLSATRSASCWAWRHKAICPRWTFCFEDTEMMRKGYPSIYIYINSSTRFLDLRHSVIKSNLFPSPPERALHPALAKAHPYFHNIEASENDACYAMESKFWNLEKLKSC